MKLTFKIWILIIFLVCSLLSIFGFPPTFLEKGALISSINSNSSAFEAGLISGQIITSVNGQKITNFRDYSATVQEIFEENQEEFVKLTIDTKQGTYVFFTDSLPDMVVEDIPASRISAGLDLQGGARALVEPERELTANEMQDLIAVTKERFNVYGTTDIVIRSVTDLEGKKFMLVEIAGTTPAELESLIAEQGKFEAKISNQSVFIGGNKDITYVCRNDATCARIERCDQVQGGYACRYSFVIHLSEEAAKRHAEITSKILINSSNPDYLDEQLTFYVDDVETTSLFISADLKGQAATQIQISGSGSGPDMKSAIEDAEDSMKKMQTILITGSLPYKLEIVKLDTISPILGEKFTKTILITALVALLVVAVIVFARYRNFKASVSLLFTSFSEIIIILGIAALIHWNLDLPSIAGILIIIGTGVDQQIVILDESKSKRNESMKQKLKSALFIVVSAFLTTFVSLIPLIWAGAGLLRGFAITTIIGLTTGVLITRPAFSDMVRLISEKESS